MLTELHIENFALVEEQSLSFGAGLNVISGETGSGKSIVLQAIQFLLGEKLKTSPLRTGAEQGEVQGLFALDQIPNAVMQELPDLARGDELSVVRSISRSGKGKVFLNGRLASVALLEEVVGKLVNICGQNHHVRLLDQRYHLDVLDGFSGNNERLDRCRRAFESWREQSRALSERERSMADREEREAMLREAVDELEAARLTPGIRADLEQKVKALANAERIVSATQRLSGAMAEEGGVIEQLERMQSEALEVSKLDPKFASALERLAASHAELKEFEFAVQRYVAGLALDEEQLTALRDQLADVARLERKYRRNDAGLIQLLDEYRGELQQMGGGSGLEQLRESVAVLEREVKAAAIQLHETREKSAKKLARLIEAGLADVAMAGSSFQVALSQTSLGPTGTDRAEFLLSPNKGEVVRPLREIASGGELSRILLVLKQVLSDRTGVNILVFDEVDTGISGAVARAVGLKLRALAASSQVICVTHLPQVASLADHHFLVGKVSGERTVTEVCEIDGDRRIDEIARMLAGYKVTAAARESARELMSSKE